MVEITKLKKAIDDRIKVLSKERDNFKNAGDRYQYQLRCNEIAGVHFVKSLIFKI